MATGDCVNFIGDGLKSADPAYENASFSLSCYMSSDRVIKRRIKGMAQLKKTLKTSQKKKTVENGLPQVNPYAAGIDIGSNSHFVAVCTPDGEVSVKEFATFTTDLYVIAQWLEENGVTTVAMESTGIYWIPLYDVLEEKGFEVKLVNARHVKNVTGRKSDVEDCRWIQQLHSCGLLQGAFRPEEKIRPLRAYSRQRSILIGSMTSHIHHMQKALLQMNLKLNNVLSDITGATGMKIIRAIVAGEHNPKTLAQFRDRRCAKTIKEIEKSLTGHMQEEHLFSLQQALESYDFCQKQILNCDEKIEKALTLLNGGEELGKSLPQQPRTYKTAAGNALYFDVASYLKSIARVDLTQIPGIDGHSALKLIGEIGTSMSPWKTAQHFTSWLGLSPENKVSGGKKLSSKTRPSANRAAQTFRIAAASLHRSESALGGFFRRLKSRLGPAKAMTATARKLAIIFYSMLKNGTEYVEAGLNAYERQYTDRLLKKMRKQAARLGFNLVPNEGLS
jgi:hypothetical protein